MAQGPPIADPVRRRGLVHAAAGLVLIVTALIGLKEDISWLAQPFYAWVWWGYILVLDGFSAWKRGGSLLTTRRRFVGPICIWSVTFWFFFELINARIQNWYYVGVFPLDAWLIGPLFTVVAFATVFMGIFQTMDALGASGLWRGWRGRRRSFRRGWTYGLQLIGLVMGGVALLFPHYLAPLVWGSFTLIVDPWNYRLGARSLLRDIEEGRLGRFARLLLAGLICGVVWESLNFFAPQKWIYTVRGLEGLKVFEMPLVGFLGFPALALDCVAAYSMAAWWLMGNRSWEYPDDLSPDLGRSVERSKAFFGITLVLQLTFWAAISWYATPVNIGSVQVELRDLGLTAAEHRLLNQQGISRPRRFLAATDSESERARIREVMDWSEARLWELRKRAALYTFKGIGCDHGRMLERVGVESPEDLKDWEPEALLKRLAGMEPPVWVAPPRIDFIRVWILAARDRSILREGG